MTGVHIRRNVDTDVCRGKSVKARAEDDLRETRRQVSGVTSPADT